MASVRDIWDVCMKAMAEKVEKPVSMEIWLNEIKPVSITGEKVTLAVPSNFYWEIIRAKYYGLIKQTLAEVLGFSVEVDLIIDAESEEEEVLAPEVSIASLPVSEEYTFDNFVVGNSNRFAYAAAQAVANNPATAYNPLFLYGGSGLGKMHLLYAIMSTVKKKNPQVNLVYKSCEEFTNELIEALANKEMQDFRDRYREADVLLIDDIQFIGGKERSQEEFFNTFETLYRAHKQIVLASDRPPKEIGQLTDRLRSRMEMGLLADIQTPDFELRMAIIDTKARSLNLELPEDVVEFLANKLKNNVRQLEGALKKILALQLINKIPPSLAVAQSAVADILNTNEPLEVVLDRIVTEVARYFSVSADDIKGSKRTSNITLARQVAMYIIREVCGLSMPQIGAVVGGRDHSTVHHSIARVESKIASDSSFALQIQDLIATVKGK